MTVFAARRNNPGAVLVTSSAKVHVDANRRGRWSGGAVIVMVRKPMNVSNAWQSGPARLRWGIGCAILFSCSLPPARALGAEPAATLPTPASHSVDFAREIQPVLARACFDCHGPQKQEAGLRLDQ